MRRLIRVVLCILLFGSFSAKGAEIEKGYLCTKHGQAVKKYHIAFGVEPQKQKMLGKELVSAAMKQDWTCSPAEWESGSVNPENRAVIILGENDQIFIRCNGGASRFIIAARDGYVAAFQQLLKREGAK